MVSSPTKSKHSRVASQQQSSNKCKLLRGSKPLLNHKFYLDIEKHHISNRIELKIKELGGSIEFFLEKYITHFVTDKHIDRDRDRSCQSPQTPTTPQTPCTPNTPINDYSNDLTSPNICTPNDTKSFAICGSKNRSRADAILQRARIQQSSSTTINNFTAAATTASTRISQSPLLTAKSWGIIIWTPEHALKFLDKVKSYTKQANNPLIGGKPANLKHLRGDYIKIQSFDHQYRPYYKELKLWPTIQLSSSTNGESPFKTQSHIAGGKSTAINKRPDNKTTTMTRKSRSKHNMRTNNKQQRSSDKQCGYCEICRVEYDVLSTHLQSKEHLNFVKNDDNFIALDTLISNGANVDTFLKANNHHHDTSIDKDDIDNGYFGKRSSRKVTKLIRPCDIDIKKDSDTSTTFAINGRLAHLQHKYSPPMTRRSNYRKSEPLSPTTNGKKSPSKSPSKTSPNKMEIDDDDDDDNISIIDNDNAVSHTIRSRRESARRINYSEEIKDDEEITVDSKADQRKKIEKIRLRGIRWRAPSIDDNQSTVNHQPIVYKVVNDKSKSVSQQQLQQGRSNDNNRKESSSEHHHKSSGIKVKICRVRESELSRLTNEADKFMFPRIFSEPLTDDDRDGSSERANCDVSTDLVSSSDVNRSRAGGSTMSPIKASPSVSVSGAKKKKMKKNSKCAVVKKKYRNNFDAQTSDYFKIEERDSRLRFQESPVQSSLITSIDKPQTITSGVPSVNVCHRRLYGTKDRTGDLLGTSTASATKASIKLSNLMKPCDYSNILPEHKFGFERIPDNESWYNAFQRQDECCEEIFQYWGSTAYRKLPFEIGPLPPLASDCCNLSKLHMAKVKVKQKGKVGRKPKKQNAKVTVASTATTTVTSSTDSGVSSSITPEDTTINSTRSREIKLPPSLDNNYKKPSTTSNAHVPPAPLSTMKAIESASSSLHNKPKIAISSTKHNALLDLSGKSRKSPREHASTLAILSCLVQQRRRREKELNGGISPEKLNIKVEIESDVSACSSPAHISDSNVPSPMQTDDYRINDDNNDTTSSKDINNVHHRVNGVIHNSVIIGGDVQPNVETQIQQSEPPPTSRPATPQIKPIETKVSHLKSSTSSENPNYVCRQLEYLLNTTYKSTLDDSYANIQIPLSPKTIDNDFDDNFCLISNPSKDFVEIVNAIESGPLRYNSLVNLNKRTGLSSLVRSSKKRRNKTGWPNSPKRRICIRKESALTNADTNENNGPRIVDGNGDENVVVGQESINSPIEQVITSDLENFGDNDDDDDDDEDDDAESYTTAANDEPDRCAVEISKRLQNDEFCIRSRQKLNSLGEDYSKDDDYSNDCGNSVIFTSSSDKAENSDIFTVSSDSLDTDLTDTHHSKMEKIDYNKHNNIVMSPLSISNSMMITTITTGTNAKQITTTTPAAAAPSDESSSVDVTLAELLKKQIGVGQQSQKRTQRLPKKKLAKKRRLGSNSRRAGAAKPSVTLPLMQPVVCVRKLLNPDVSLTINGKLPINKINKLSLTAAAINNDNDDDEDDDDDDNDYDNKSKLNGTSTETETKTIASSSQQCTNNSKNSSPTTQFSPRKLRKPRGRWYRER